MCVNSMLLHIEFHLLFALTLLERRSCESSNSLCFGHCELSRMFLLIKKVNVGAFQQKLTLSGIPFRSQPRTAILTLNSSFSCRISIIVCQCFYPTTEENLIICMYSCIYVYGLYHIYELSLLKIYF